ncbi:MAG: ion channel [bacterium]
MNLSSKYSIEIIDKIFDYSKFEDIYSFRKSKTAVINLSKDNTSSQVVLEFCCPDLEEVYSLIDDNKDVNLNYCFLEGFSISNYRKSKNIHNDETVTINNFSCQNAFITNEKVSNKSKIVPNTLNLYNVKFKGDSFQIRNSMFSNGNINFEDSEFQVQKIQINSCNICEGKLNFSNCKFSDCELDFSNSVFGKGDKIFTNTEFGRCSLKFTGSEFADSTLDFSFSKFDGSDFDFSKAKFIGGKIDFSKASLGAGNKDFSNVDFGECGLLFLNTKFNDGNVYFQGSKFKHADVDFYRARFGAGMVDFSYIQFGKGVKNFSNTKFGDGDVNFSYTDFGSGDLNFSKSVFGKGNKDFSHGVIGPGKVDFTDVDFGNGSVDFNNTVFGNGNISFNKMVFAGGKINFSSVQFGKGDVDFSEVNCMKGYINFGECLFTQNKISFYNSIIPVISFQKCQFNHYTDLRVNQCSILDLRNTIFRDIIDLKPDGTAEVIIQHLNFAEVKNSGLIYIDWKLNKLKESIMVQENTTIRQKAEQFRMLKENFHNIGQYDYEDDSYVEYKRLESKADYYESVRRKDTKWFKKFAEGISYFLKWLILDQIGRFGTSPLRVLKSIFAAFIFFTVLYYPLQDIPNFDHKGIVSEGGTTLEDAAYFSAYNMLIIGYEDYHPRGITGILSVAESFSGLFLISYFTIAFVRKVLR